MSYLSIFEEIVSITNTDYAGFEEKKGWGKPEAYRGLIKRLEADHKLKPNKFADIVNDYLSDFQDHHLYFLLHGSESTKPQTIGFQVRRKGDTLYVTDVQEETRVKKGDTIKLIDGKTIPIIASEEVRLVGERSYERQHWMPVLKGARNIELGNGRILEMQKYDRVEQKPVYQLKEINSETLLLIFSDFNHYEAIRDFIEESKPKLRKAKNLIIDVRNNGGGNVHSVDELLPFLFKPGEKPSFDVPKREFNCTSRNVELFAKQVSEARSYQIDSQTLEMLESAPSTFESNKDKGFTEFDFSAYLQTLEKDFQGESYPLNVCILTDNGCASAGEDFVRVAMESSKVTVIGRATMGINDYSDLLQVSWNEEFSLYYPLSRARVKTEVDPIHGKGIKPHYYLEWSPEFILQDKDLELALEMLEVRI